MNQCLRMNITMIIPKDFLHEVIQKKARENSLEGTVQASGQYIKIIVCGSKSDIDIFVDAIHKELSKKAIEGVEIEPFLKDKDYRGVFRVIE